MNIVGTKKYDDAEATSLVQQALSLAGMSPIFNVTVKNGELDYLVCKPFEHALRERGTNEWYDVIAADDAVVVATNRRTGINSIIYQAGLMAFDIVEKSQTRYTASAGLEMSMPDIGSVWTHNNGNTYMVFGLANLHAQEQNRDKYPIVVLYIGSNGYIWAKSAENFVKSATLGGTFRFKDGIKMEYMGVSDNGALENGFMTTQIKALMEFTDAQEA
jgi:hypothetical protein